MKEMLDIYDDKLQKIGIKSRQEVHKYGLKHKVVQCYIIQKDKNGKMVYFQQRAWDKDTCPGMYDIACAGHVDAGEDFIDSMKRELVEEVGIEVDDSKLKYVGTTHEYYKKGECIDDEICEMFILEVNNDSFFKINEELLDMVKVSFAEYEKWVNNDVTVIEAYSINSGNKIEVKEENVCPHIKRIDEKILYKIKEF